MLKKTSRKNPGSILRVRFDGLQTREVSAPRRIAAVLPRARDQVQEYLDLAEVAFVALDGTGQITLINKKGCEILGYDEPEILGQNWFEVCLPPEMSGKVKGLFDQLMAGNMASVERYETPVLTKTGEQRLLAFNHTVRRDQSAQIVGIMFSGEDITAHKQAEAALWESEELYRSLFEHMLNGFAYCKMLYEQNQPQDFIYLKVNRSFEALTGLKNVVGKRVSEVIPGLRESDPKLLEIYDRVALTGKPEKFETYVKALKMWFSISVYSPAKEFFVTIFDVITARKQAEEELRASAQKWRSTFNAIGDAVCLLNREARIMQCNQAMVDLVGKPFIEILGHPCWELVHGTEEPIAGCPLERMWRSRSRETITYLLGDRWLHGIVDPILNEAREVTGGVLIIADVTKYKRAEDKIRDLITLLRAIKDINEALLRVKSEPELFQNICDLLVKVPYVRFAWIGLVEAGSFEVKPSAWAGVEDGYLSSMKVTWDDSSYGRGPTGTAIKTRQATEVGDIGTDPRFSPWRQEAHKRGYASSIALPLVHLEETLGNLSVYSGTKHAFGQEELEFLNQVAGDIAVGIRSLRLERDLEQSLEQLRRVGEQTVAAIASMAELRDPYTAGHQRKVSQLACALAAEMGLPGETIEALRVAGFLHDIGKIVVPTEILNKPGQLSQYEFSLIKTHSQAGYDILQGIEFPWPIAQIVLQHHERLDKSGYPAGLSAADILLEAKILAVADVVEAMASYRPYRAALGLEAALAEITKNKGVLYDPEVVAACLRLFSQKKFSFAA